MALIEAQKYEILEDIELWTRGKTPDQMTQDEIIEYVQHGMSIQYADQEDEVKEWLLTLTDDGEFK